MESWRERGFVPDSDSEDEFDSQDAKRLSEKEEKKEEQEAEAEDFENSDSENVAVPSTTPATGTTQDDEDGGNVEPDDSSRDDNADRFRHDAPSQTTDNEDEIPQEGGHEDTQSVASDGGSRGSPATPKDIDEDTDSQSTPITRNNEGGNPPPSPSLPTTRDASPSTPRAKQPANNLWDVPSSSPDELQMDFLPPRRPVPPPPSEARDT